MAGGIGWQQTLIVGIASIILLGGTVALLLIGRPVPEFLVGFDGAIVTGLVMHGGFLALNKGQQSATTALANAHLESIGHMRDIVAREHELAMSVVGKTTTPEHAVVGIPSVTVNP